MCTNEHLCYKQQQKSNSNEKVDSARVLVFQLVFARKADVPKHGLRTVQDGVNAFSLSPINRTF